MKISLSYLRRLTCLGLSLLLIGMPADAATSNLWGQIGELWEPTSRLPDFSRAGYRGGEVPIPDVPIVTNVKDFGAVGDGVADDSDAFLDALKATANGAVFIPAGRYKITEQIKITKSNVVFRGAGVSQTTLYFPSSLNDVVGPADENAPGGSWSWSGGFFQVPGYNSGAEMAKVTVAAKQGDTQLTVSKTTGMSVGQRIRVILWNTDGSWAKYILGNLYPEPPAIADTKGADFPCKIIAISGNVITIDRPLRTDVRLVWTPQIHSDIPTLHDIGVEDMTLEFPEVPYPGHHSEPGFNGFDFRTVENCWIRRIRFINCDSGIFLHESSWFNTVQSVRFSAGPKRFVTGYDYLPEHPYSVAGHHGLVALSYAMDNLFKDFHFDMRMLHELSTENQSTGNVFSSGDGLDMVIDFHRRAPYGNLFTNINVGAGNRIWESGGDHSDGPESGMWETFWNVRSAKPFGLPDKWEYKAVLINLVGITTNLLSLIPLIGNWIEAIVPSTLTPPDLHVAMVAYHKGSPADSTPPSAPAGLSATAVSPTQINLAWSASTDNVGVSGYKVFSGSTLLTTTPNRTYSHTGLTPSKTYTYTVAAYDAVNNTSAASNTATATTQAPPSLPPVITSPDSGEGEVGLNFEFSVEATNAPTQYTATGLPNGLSIDRESGVISGTPTTAGTFNARLTATNASGSGTQTWVIVITAPPESIAPPTPKNLKAAVISENQIMLTWDPSVGVSGVLAGYSVYIFGSKIANAASNTYLVNGLAPATTFRFSVSAYDDVGNHSAPSASATATTFVAQVPSVPRNLKAVPKSTTQISLSWDASTERNGVIGGYHVYRNGVKIANVPTPSITDTGLRAGTAYTYRVLSYDNRGLTSALSSSLATTTFSSTYLPVPTLVLPASMPVNGSLSAGYPATLSNIGFEWTFTLSSPGTPTAAGNGPAAAAAAPAASFKTLDKTAYLAPHGLPAGPYVVTVRAFDVDGMMSPAAQASVMLVSADLTNVKVYPNPWRTDKHAGVLMNFETIPVGSTIKIFTVSGHFVQKLTVDTNPMKWDLKNDSGDTVASGIYLYLITTPEDQTTKGKFVIIR